MQLSKSVRDAEIAPGLIVAFIVLTALALIYFAWPVYRAFLPLQIDPRDAWNTLHADPILAGRPLYTPDYFVLNNYPPLSFYLLSAISAVTGFDELYIGRTLSLAATVAIAPAVWLCIRQLGGSRTGASLGALWWFASIARWFSFWVGTNDPDLVALAMMMWALVLALRPATGRRLELAIAIMAVAGFYKHNFIAIPTATLWWLALREPRRGLCLTLTGLGIVALGLAACAALFGKVFFYNMLLPRHYGIGGLGDIGRTQFIAPALIVVIIWILQCRRRDACRFVLIFGAISLLSFAVQSLADGVSDNAMFELVLATAIGIGCAFDDLGKILPGRGWPLERRQPAVLGILIVRLLISQRMSPYLLLQSPEFRSDLNRRAAMMKSEAARIASIPGPVDCSVTLACHFAGKQFAFDNFVVHEYIVTGRASGQDVAARIERLGIRLERVDPRVDINDLH